MRIGLRVPAEGALDIAVAADAAGIPILDVTPAGDDTAIDTVAELAEATRDVRLVAPFRLGEDHPVTLAEEFAVVDQISAGRLIALFDTGGLDAQDASEELALIAESWSGRWLSFRGRRWSVPAGLHDGAPTQVAVTPTPVQLEPVVWLQGRHAGAVAEATGIGTVVASVPERVSRGRVAPGRARLVGERDVDCARIQRWAQAGATALVFDVPDGFDGTQCARYVARYLVPEAASPNFPRIISDSAWPREWHPDAS